MGSQQRSSPTDIGKDRFADAVAIAEAVGGGAVSAEEVCRSALARISEHEGLGAFTVVVADDALGQAAAADARIREGERLALAGVPVAVKDHIWVRGAPATNGSRVLRDFVPEIDCVAVARLREAGAVLIGKTNNPEFCYRGYTDSPLWGLTRNPWDHDRTPGGSSGGSAVAVATGMAALGIGTDGGGSIRIPAAFCGVVGHKPTFGVVPTLPGFRGWRTLSVHGPLARSVRDAALMLDVMAGPHPADDLTVPTLPSGPCPAEERLTGLRVAVSEDFGFAAVDAEVRAAFRASVDRFAQLGCALVDAKPPTADPLPIWWTIAAAEGFASEGPLLTNAEEMATGSADIIRAGEHISARDYLEAQEQRGEFSRSWARYMQHVDLVLSPAEQVLPFAVGIPAPATVEGRPSDPVFEDWWGMDAVANLTNQPAICVPAGLTTSGLPVGIQLMGRRFQDRLVLAAAAAWERHQPWRHLYADTLDRVARAPRG